jgi:hypothetical protein
MWIRDWELARHRLVERERELRKSALLADLAGRRVRHHGLLRGASAALIRRFGATTLALAERIDSCTTGADQGAAPGIALR